MLGFFRRDPLRASTEPGRSWDVGVMEIPETDARALSARWQRGADRLARVGWLVLLAAVAVALERPAIGIPQIL